MCYDITLSAVCLLPPSNVPIAIQHQHYQTCTDASVNATDPLHTLAKDVPHWPGILNRLSPVLFQLVFAFSHLERGNGVSRLELDVRPSSSYCGDVPWDLDVPLTLRLCGSHSGRPDLRLDVIGFQFGDAVPYGIRTADSTATAFEASGALWAPLWLGGVVVALLIYVLHSMLLGASTVLQQMWCLVRVSILFCLDAIVSITYV